MKNLNAGPKGDLLWIQDGVFTRQYELRDDESLFARLRWEGSFGSLATAEVEAHRYTFKRRGFLRARITARLDGADADFAVFEPGWARSGPFTVDGARAYHWSTASFWKAAWGFTDAHGQRVAEFQAKFSVARTLTGIEVARSALANPDLPLLVTFGWYLLVMMATEDGGAAAVIASS